MFTKKTENQFAILGDDTDEQEYDTQLPEEENIQDGENNANGDNTTEEEEEFDAGAFFDQIIQSIIVYRQLPMLMNNEGIDYVSSSLVYICDYVKQILLQEDSLLYLESPIKICGDIHGQLNDLVRVLQTGGFDVNSKYLFLGDYVDRGPNSLEVICLLFALKCRFPSNVFLLRGNHESPEMTESFGFAYEVVEKLKDDEQANYVLSKFYEAFDCLPIAALISNKIFCVHGGLSPKLKSIEDILSIERPTDIPEEGILADLLWSDPNINTQLWGPNDRGATWTWGQKIATDFIKANKLNKIVRGHQMAQNGINFPFYPDRSVITVFTASNYAGQYNNVAAFVEVDKDPTNISFRILKHIEQKPEVHAPNTPRVNKSRSNYDPFDDFDDENNQNSSGSDGNKKSNSNNSSNANANNNNKNNNNNNNNNDTNNNINNDNNNQNDSAADGDNDEEIKKEIQQIQQGNDKPIVYIQTSNNENKMGNINFIDRDSQKSIMLNKNSISLNSSTDKKTKMTIASVDLQEEEIDDEEDYAIASQ